MSTASPSRRTWEATIRRFTEVAWTRHGPTRYLSVALTPALVWILVPGGWWWAGCAVGAAVGVMLDLRTEAAFARLCRRLPECDDGELLAAVRGHVAALAAITAAYVLPYAALAFAPQPGPVIGLLFCAGAALICATLHVMTRAMIFFTAPAVVLGLGLNAYALGEGPDGAILAAVAALLGANAIVAARAGARSFGDLIAARMRAEEAAEHLERRVEERTRQLQVATRRAHAANRAKSVFLANMSHELRTPLNAVIGYAEMIEEDIASGDTQRSAADLSKIRAAAAHLLAMINEVLDFSRIEAGRLELRPTRFDLAALLHGAVDVIRPLASKHRANVEVRLAPELGEAIADETRVRQCVLNLLSNAAKFTADGVITLEARPCLVGGAAGVAIQVRDTGCGIAPDGIARLFQPFVQVDASTTRRHDGAGLGLVITRRLARAMGGDVTADSKLGAGSTFTLHLPLEAAETQAAAA